ncbi:MAG: phosphoribosyltransferase [Gemmataceae bacterium]|mgnify:CR=1 FL=1
MFRDRAEAARQLAARLRDRHWHNLLVLAIPRGGVVTGATLAEELGAELDVVLARKLAAPGEPELALGAVAEDGSVFLNSLGQEWREELRDYLEAERVRQLEEIARRRQVYRAVRPPATIQGRSVVVTDDGIATGATMIAALQATRGQNPHELIVAVPVAPPERLAEVRRWCDETICLLTPETFWAVGQFYEHFDQVSDEQVVELLRHAWAARTVPTQPS